MVYSNVGVLVGLKCHLVDFISITTRTWKVTSKYSFKHFLVETEYCF